MHQRHAWELQTRVQSPEQKFSVGIFQDLSTLKDFNWIVSMVKSDLMDTYTITDISCVSISNEYVSGKNNKILPIPQTMQGISTSTESMEERSKKNTSLFHKTQISFVFS